MAPAKEKKVLYLFKCHWYVIGPVCNLLYIPTPYLLFLCSNVFSFPKDLTLHCIRNADMKMRGLLSRSLADADVF